MDYRRVGNSGLLVSQLCLGAMMFGDQTERSEAHRIIAAARDAGVNFLDTANVYAEGRSEEIVGAALRGERDRWVLATKVGSPMGTGVIEKSMSRKRIMMELEGSLRRLQTDFVDLYYLHRDYLDTPLEEPVGTMGDLIRQGKIRYWGFSNFNAWRIAELIMVADRLGVPRPVVTQPCYNAMNRMLEQEYLPACAHFGIGVVPYSPLARGVLTGKYGIDTPPPAGSRVDRKDGRILEIEFRKESLRLAGKIKERAERRGTTATAFSIAWVLNNALVTALIAGPKTLDQWQGYLAALDCSFNAADEAFVDKLVPPGFNSTPFFGDPKLPPRGRVPRT